jgi:hypothetical protein
MLASVDALISQLRSQPRLRLGLWLVVAILWFYGILTLQEAADRALVDHDALAAQVVRMRAVGAEGEWPARAESARAKLVEMEARLWQAGSVGLSQATLQDLLGQMLRESAVMRPTLAVSTETSSDGESRPSGSSELPALREGLWKVTAKLAFDGTPMQLTGLLEALRAEERLLVVETLNVRASIGLHGEMTLAAYFQKPVEQASRTTSRSAGKEGAVTPASHVPATPVGVADPRPR